MNHEELQAQGIQLGQLLGWRHLHVRRTVGRGKKWTTATNVKGWPDCLFWHPGRGGLFLVEWKIPPDDLSPEQEEVIASLRQAGQTIYVWTPADLAAMKTAFSVLRGQQPPNLLLQAVRLLESCRTLGDLPFHVDGAIDAFLLQLAEAR